MLIFSVIPYQPTRSIYNDNWNGTSKLRERVEDFNITTSRILVSPIILDSNIDIKVLVIIGSERKYTTPEVDAIEKFVNRGGSLIIFEDTGHAKTIASRFDVEFLPGILKEIHPSRYINRPEQMFIWDVFIKQFLPGVTLNPLLGSDMVGIVDLQGFQSFSTFPLLATSPDAFADVNENNVRDKDDITSPLGIPVALFKPIGEKNGTVTIVGGSSIPLNQYWDKEVSTYNYNTEETESFQISNTFWLQMLVGLVTNVTGTNEIVFDESHSEVMLTSAGGLFNLIAGTWVAMINTAIISIFTIVLTFVLASARLRSKVKQAIRRKTNPNVSNVKDEVYISHPTLAERMISEEYILYQVMGDGFIHVANTALVNFIRSNVKDHSILNELEKEYGNIAAPQPVDVLLEIHGKLRDFVEENRSKWL